MDVSIFGYTMSLTWFLALSAIVLYVMYDWWSHTYWRRKGLVHVSPWPILGNLPSLLDGIPHSHLRLRKELGKTYGIYNFKTPMLMAGDPDMLRQMLVKSFSHFRNRIYFPQMNKEFTHGVSIIEDERWREVRNVLTPTFSASKMKQMSFLVNECADKLVENIGRMQEAKGFVECKELFGAFVMDTIGSCGFGLQIDSQANPNHPFVEHARRLFVFKARNIFFLLIGAMFPTLAHICGYLEVGLIFPKDVMKFFADVTRKAVKMRADGGSEQKYMDFLQLMIDAQRDKPDKIIEKESNEDDIHADLEKDHDEGYHTRNLGKAVRLSEDEVIGQAITFFTGGYETTNTLLGFIFYALSMNSEIQEKLIQEVDEMMPSRDSVGYTSIAAMPYLDQVVCETLRLYPPAAILQRTCNETFHHNGMTIEKGLQIFIPVYTIHHDPEYWPEPEKFDPDRFSKANKAARHPFAWLPFGAGPRNCIAMRFALMETKMAVARVLQKYRFQTCPQTEIPPVFSRNGFLSPPNGVTLKAVPRTDAVNL